MAGAGAEHGAVRDLARDIMRCGELESVLAGRDSSCREVVSWQGLDRAGRWYVPEPWAGHLGTAAILFVSSNPSAGEPGERFDRSRHMSRRDSDEDLFAAADGAFDDRRFPGIAAGRYNRDRAGRRAGPKFWRWTQGIARELLGREPEPGADYALTEVVHWEAGTRPGSLRPWGPARAGTCGACCPPRPPAWWSSSGPPPGAPSTASSARTSPAALRAARAAAGPGSAASCWGRPATSSRSPIPTRASPPTAPPVTSRHGSQPRSPDSSEPGHPERPWPPPPCRSRRQQPRAPGTQERPGRAGLQAAAPKREPLTRGRPGRRACFR
jgi:hypothetical protein